MFKETARHLITLLAIAGCCVHAASADTDRKYYDPRLYAPKPPPGSSYVRVVNGGTAAAHVVIAAGAAVTLTPKGTVVSTYRIIQGGKSLVVTVDGQASNAVAVPPDKYLTLIYRPSSSGPKLTTVTDAPGDDDGLLAELRVYNLISNCVGALALQNGSTVFDHVATDGSKARAINPVSAVLVPMCGTTRGVSLKLPLLKGRDHYSIFLVGNAAKPVAVGNADQTEPYKG